MYTHMQTCIYLQSSINTSIDICIYIHTSGIYIRKYMHASASSNTLYLPLQVFSTKFSTVWKPLNVYRSMEVWMNLYIKYKK